MIHFFEQIPQMQLFGSMSKNLGHRKYCIGSDDYLNSDQEMLQISQRDVSAWIFLEQPILNHLIQQSDLCPQTMRVLTLYFYYKLICNCGLSHYIYKCIKSTESEAFSQRLFHWNHQVYKTKQINYLAEVLNNLLYFSYMSNLCFGRINKPPFPNLAMICKQHLRLSPIPIRDKGVWKW